MDEEYIKVLKQLEYDIPSACNWIEMHDMRRGDIMKMGLKLMIREATTTPYISFKSNVLIFADRLYGIAVGLHYFFEKCTDVNVTFASFDGRAIIDAVNNKEHDFLIVVGYMLYQENYNFIDTIRKQKNAPRLVMLASPDALIRSICNRHQIPYVFDRHEPTEKFVEYLQSIQSKSI